MTMAEAFEQKVKNDCPEFVSMIHKIYKTDMQKYSKLKQVETEMKKHGFRQENPYSHRL